MSSLYGILCLLSALAATSCSNCYAGISIMTRCPTNNNACPSGEECPGGTGDKMAKILAWTYKCASKCNFLGSMRLQQLQISMSTLCYGHPNCPSIANSLTDNSPLNGLVCPSCLSANSTWCHTDETIQCRGDETMCLLLQTLESGSMSTSTTFRGCATMSICDLGSQSQNKTGSFTEVKINCTRASTSGSNRGSMSDHKVVLTSAIVCLLLKLLF
ncbi:uncharacterized protein LOC120992361 isoform X2 [Bufo bufo]|uniref:uncharacterized protein LOC120992361 isoform X2 n=1 Tax=Bufo bufo TaxID=8384 RepID=UPI001ABEBCAB|nr:uncharacterized protein LOC120992361 isoform X2 [Bufo bufo]